MWSEGRAMGKMRDSMRTKVVLAQFKCAKRYSILRRFAEQITYRYRYFNKNVYFAKHNNS